jgi:putative ABC transport system substrate-binding protein
VQEAARASDVEVFLVEVRDEGTAEDTTRTVLGAMAQARDDGADGLLLLTDALFHTRRSLIAQAALELGLPTMYSLSEFAEVGGLMAYAPDTASVYRKTAEYVDRILRGARPPDMPIERQTQIELVFNVDTAEELGIAVPTSLQEQISRTVRSADRSQLGAR